MHRRTFLIVAALGLISLSGTSFAAKTHLVGKKSPRRRKIHVPAAPEELGAFVARVAEDHDFIAPQPGYGPPYRIEFRRTDPHTVFGRVVDTDSAYAQSADVQRWTDAGQTGRVFYFGGDGDAAAGPTPWRKSALLPGPDYYTITGESWYFGRSRPHRTHRIRVDKYEKGFLFKINCEDAGRWAHGSPVDNDGDFNDLQMQLAVGFAISDQSRVQLMPLSPQGFVIL